VPGVYYGDEIGMTDLPSLGSRGCMIWDERKWNRSLQETYRRLIALRKRSTALQRGGFQLLAVEAETVAYQREVRDERLLVVAHRGAHPRPAEPLPVVHGGIEDGAQLAEVFTGKRLRVENGCLPLDSHLRGATVWQEVR
jgi:alpha-glucosidase